MSNDFNINSKEPERPIIIIERDDEPSYSGSTSEPKNRFPWLLLALCALIVGLLALLGYSQYRKAHNLDIPISFTPEENIQKLRERIVKTKPWVEESHDSILGVKLNFYAIHGLQASIEMKRPFVADKNVYLYCRSADYTADGKYLGSLVAKGVEKESEGSRLGYMGMADGRMVIGVSKSDAVKDYILERKGSFFRQFVLVSNGVLPTQFYLHGKVERRAIGRKDDTFYLVCTSSKETLWDFADALCEYGFVDVIYITGGSDPSYYRSKDGKLHWIGDITVGAKKEPDVPWLVFRPI